MSRKKNKKTKMKKTPPKARTAYTYFTSKEKVTEIDIAFDPGSHAFSTSIPIENGYHEVTYERDGKAPKALNITPIIGEKFHLDANNSLRNFDALIAIDTNDKEINGELHSSTGIIIAEWLSSPTDAKHIYSYDCPFCIEYMSLQSPREIIGWCLALQHLNDIGLVRRFDKVGVVVDSYMGELSEFNNRTLPLYQNFYLPQQFTLVYASADTGSEFIANRLLKDADKAATTILEHLAMNFDLPYPDQVYSGPWEKVRFIVGKKSN